MADSGKLAEIFEIRGTVQNYEWGGLEYIPDLFDLADAGQKPHAEMWFGAHPQSPSLVPFDDQTIPLDQLIAQHAAEFMGTEAAQTFGGKLPFLLKVLDVRQMLSIQVHPSKTQAQAGFARENALGVALDASHRNYKDDHHKPEVHVAVSDFWMLHGFRPLREIAALLKEHALFRTLAMEFSGKIQQVEAGMLSKSAFLKALYSYLMTLPQEQIDATIEPVIAPLQRRYRAGELSRQSPDFWAARAASQFVPATGKYDRGIFSIYLLNLVSLKPGQGTFQDAGVLHAYLEGQNVELMANSDNVLRGGLTPKHIDIPELLQTVRFEAGLPEILTGVKASDYERVYKTPAPDFQLCVIEVPAGAKYAHRNSMALYLVFSGHLLVRHAGGDCSFKAGQVFFACAGAGLQIAAEQPSTLYRAGMP